MTRRTTEARARDLAAKLGVELDVEIDDGFEFAVEMWGYPAHMKYDGETHGSIASMSGFDLRSKAAVWRRVIEDLNMFIVCESGCECRQEGQ